MDSAPTMLERISARLRSWEGLLLAILIFVILVNALFASGYTGSQNQVNLWWISVEKAIVVLSMTFVIINGEIDFQARHIQLPSYTVLKENEEAGGYRVQAEPADSGQLNRIASESGVLLRRIEPRSETLEDVFLRMTDGRGEDAHPVKAA